MSIPTSAKLFLDGVTIVDTRDGHLTPGMNILMDKGRIVSAQPADSITPTQNTGDSIQRIDARGKFVVPGYNDMHAHPLGPEDPSGTLALMLANGVTGFRQMGGSPEMLEERREGTLPISQYSPAVLIMPGSILTPLNAGSPAVAVSTVRELKEEGADFIKVGLVSPPAFFAALDESGRLHIPFAGHLQNGVDAAEASKRGMRAVEHLGPGDTQLISCSSAEPELRQQVSQAGATKGPPFKVPFGDAIEKILWPWLKKIIINPATLTGDKEIARFSRILDTYSEDKCKALAALFVADGTWQVPTLIRALTTELADAPEYQSDPNLRYMSPATLKDWRDVTHRYVEKVPASSRAVLQRVYAPQMKVAKVFDDAGVKMLAGSDVSGGWEVPGFSLHQEFDELGRAGISPLHVLQMTTSNAGEFLGRTAVMGSVAPGMNADLVLLDANPIEDVANLHRIAAVVRAGFYYARPDLDAIMARVQAAGGASL